MNSLRSVARRFGAGPFLLHFFFTPLQKLALLRFPDHETVLNVEGMKIIAPSPRKNIIEREIFTRGVWEPEVTDFVKRHIFPGDIICDIGADTGYYTLLFSRGAGASGHVLAFEPWQHALKILQRNIELNALKNVSAHDFALGDKETVLFLKEPGKASQLSNDGDWEKDQKVNVKCFDAVQSEIAPRGVTFVKMDIEGAEGMVLRGMKRTLEKFHPRLLIEFHLKLLPDFGDSYPPLSAWLKTLGYKMEVVSLGDGLVTVYFKA